MSKVRTPERLPEILSKLNTIARRDSGRERGGDFIKAYIKLER